jgi:cold shock CspA family protein
MFTLKFFKKPYPDGSESSAVVFAKSYEKYKRSNGSTEIIVHDSAIQNMGVCYNVSNEEQHYQTCYVENIAGKTIDTVNSLTFADPS